MFSNIRRVKISTGKEIEIFDLTIGMIDKIDQDSEADTPLNVIGNASDLTDDEINSLRRSDAKILYEAIIVLTYPDVYNEDGTKKELPIEAEGKKKA